MMITIYRILLLIFVFSFIVSCSTKKMIRDSECSRLKIKEISLITGERERSIDDYTKVKMNLSKFILVDYKYELENGYKLQVRLFDKLNKIYYFEIENVGGDIILCLEFNERFELIKESILSKEF